MKRDETIQALKRCIARGPNFHWFGESALRGLPKGVDPKLVERAMKIILPWSPALVCAKLADEYAPIAVRVLATAKIPHATFLRSYAHAHAGERLRRGGAWLAQSNMIDRSPRNRRRVAELAKDAAGLAAARATIVGHGAAAKQLLAVVAHDDHADSIDALVDVVHDAIANRGDALDTLVEWFVPFARGPRMIALAAELTAAREDRGSQSPLLALARRFGARDDRLALDVAIDSREVHAGYVRRATVWIVLSSHDRPHVSASITFNRRRDFTSTRWADGATKRDENKLGVPAGVDDLPRWVAASAKKLRVTWDPTTMLVTSSLRGKARTQALAWLLGG